MVGQFELAFRVATGLFVIVAPTLLFLGFWNGLLRLRDDDLVEKVRRMDGSESPSGAASGVTAASVADPRCSEAVDCDACGATNQPGTRFCRACLARLSGE